MIDVYAKLPGLWKPLAMAFVQWFRFTPLNFIYHKGKNFDDYVTIIDLTPEQGNRVMRQLLLKCREMESLQAAPKEAQRCGQE